MPTKKVTRKKTEEEVLEPQVTPVAVAEAVEAEAVEAEAEPVEAPVEAELAQEEPQVGSFSRPTQDVEPAQPQSRSNDGFERPRYSRPNLG